MPSPWSSKIRQTFMSNHHHHNNHHHRHHTDYSSDDYNPYLSDPSSIPPQQMPLPVKTSPTHSASPNSINGSHIIQHPRDILSPSDTADTCPVCLEPLSFSFRLPGEKPHIVPECNHALHEACFVAVYAPPGTRSVAQIPRKTNLGVCGVCRKPMKVGEGDAIHGGGSSGKSNKLAALTGMGDKSTTIYPGRNSSATPTGSSSRIATSTPAAINPGNNTPTPYDPNDDDPLDPISPAGGNASVRSGNSGHGTHPHAHGSPHVVAPSITVKPEFNTLTRSMTEPTQPLTCIVTIELPNRRAHPHSQVPMPMGIPKTMMDDYLPSPSNVQRTQTRGHVSDKSDTTIRHAAHDSGHGANRASTSSTSTGSTSPPTQYAYNATPAPSHSSDPFVSITEDLRNRIIDWKGHPLSGLGPLQMYDLLSVRRDALVREFYVYLFREAIICVVEERKRSIANRLLGAGNGNLSDHTLPSSTSPGGGRGVLRLKGRIYVRHIKQVTETSVQGELSLTIDMEDERLESFILIFKERGSLEAWRSRILELVVAFRGRENAAGNVSSNRVGVPAGGATTPGNGFPDFAGGYPPQRVGTMSSLVTSESLTTSVSHNDSLLAQGSSRSTLSSSTTSHSQSHATYTASSSTPNNAMHLKHSPSSVSAAQSAGSGASGSGSGGSVASGGDDYANNVLAGHTANMNLNISYTYPPPSNFITPHVSNGPSNSLPPIPHTPFDLILVLSLPPPNASPSTAALKYRVIKTSLDFIIASLGGRDRLSIVTFEAGMGGRVRRTPFLCPGRPQGLVRLKRFVEGIGSPYNNNTYPESSPTGVNHEDEFLIRTPRDEKTDVVTAVNHALDIVLQRKARNYISGMLLVSDSADSTRRAQMDLVLARAEAANVPIHSFGYGRSHDPASLWLMSNHTSGTYTFIKDWYDLRDCLAGCLGGMMSVALTNMKLHMRVVDGRRFRVRKVSGGPACIVSSDGADVDVDVGELRFGERKEMLVEVELDNGVIPSNNGRNNGGVYDRNDNISPPPLGVGSSSRPRNATEQFVANMGLDLTDSTLSGGSGGNTGLSTLGSGVLGGMDGAASLAEGLMEGMIDEIPVFEVDGSFYDPAVGKQVSRLAHPVLLTVTLLPPGSSSSVVKNGSNSNAGSIDPVIVRRRMELLASDMITRALVLVSRKNVSQAQRILNETKRILHTVLQNITQSLLPQNPHALTQAQTHRNRREALTFSAVRTLQSILADISLLSEALLENVELFAHDQRNFGAQQAMILRDQKSWTGRSATERVFWTAEVANEMVERSRDWIGRE